MNESCDHDESHDHNKTMLEANKSHDHHDKESHDHDKLVT